MKIRCNMPPDHDQRCPWEHTGDAPPDPVVVASRSRRRFAFGFGCFIAAWVVAGFLEHYEASVLLAVGVLLVAMLVIAWLSDRVDT